MGEVKSQDVISWIDRHLGRTKLLPKRVDEMNEIEAAIFEIAASHHGFLLFLRDHLRGGKGHA